MGDSIALRAIALARLLPDPFLRNGSLNDVCTWFLIFNEKCRTNADVAEGEPLLGGSPELGLYDEGTVEGAVEANDALLVPLLINPLFRDSLSSLARCVAL
jgi:hypothetical protein